MKRCISMILAVVLLLTCMFAASPQVHASSKTSTSRAIGIVFDNSGSMYISGNQAWCRATYAMEVFASMLNTGDTLQIYPMHPITVGGAEYTMDKPFQVTDAAQASTIRDISTKDAEGTPIESIDAAVQGLQTVKADKKYMIVLTDGAEFDKDGHVLYSSETVRQLDERFQKYAGADMTVMYLGIGSSVAMPNTEQSEHFVKKQAKNSDDVLSALTDMCNQIFGRDTLPEENLSNKKVEFDISMSKLIVFVQGENVSGVSVSGDSGAVGEKLSETSTKYGTAGAENYDSVPDTSLQGMMVTYADCAAGSYTIDYTGTATDIEVYYEPDADLDFVFTDAAGNLVDKNALYEGEYKVSFGMKDAKTGKLIDSKLLGNPHYNGSYSVNGQQTEITHDGYSGETPVSLSMNDTFDANLTVTYLSGYTITKDASDFGWPSGGIQVAARPAGDLTLEITGGEELYSLQNLEEGKPYTAKVYYQGTQLTGDELESVELKWDPDTSNAEIKQSFRDDHFDLELFYKDADAPQDTVCGPCTVTIQALYAAKGSSQAQTQCAMTYNIKDDFSPLQMELQTTQDYIVIAEMGSCQPITAQLTLNGAALTAEEFAAVQVQADCGGIDYELTPNEQTSSYTLQLLPTENIAEGEYRISVTAVHTDNIGRQTQVEETLKVTLSNIPLWVRWAISLLALLILLIIIILILRIRVLPKAHINKRDSRMSFDDEDVSTATSFDGKIEKGQMVAQTKYAGTKFGLAMEVKPGKESYLYKSQGRRSAEVKSASVRKFGQATIQEATIGSIRYVLNEETNKLERVPKSDKPFTLKHGMNVNYSGTMLNAGIPKPFSVNTKLNFKKK